MNKKIVTLGLASASLLVLGACGDRSEKSSSKSETKVAMIADVGGIDDKSFNQSAWEGLQAWGKENDLKKGSGFDYLQSSSEADYTNNLDTAASSGYNLIFGIGFTMQDAIDKVSADNPDTNYAIVDGLVEERDNVVSVSFGDNEAAYLAGVAAAKATKTNHVGFVGGRESVSITRFEKGFEAGVKSVDNKIKVDIAYAGSFADAAKGKTIAATQYAAGADVIYHAAGGTGAGVFNEAKLENETRNEDDKVWVIGADRDQSGDGNYTSKDGKKSNFVLASTIKEVGKALQIISNDTKDGKFPGGKVEVFGLKEEGVDLAMTGLSEDGQKAVEDAKKAIIDGDVKVPEK
ncbi:Membrane lipoprotein TmpC [Streptococcus pluranimalium]|uniref:BMP family lipoprotein n=1 Tax=Streptococcus pluranimalium TaxID=82348 RepID=UPI0039ED13F4